MWDLLATLFIWLFLACSISVGMDIYTYEDRKKKWEAAQMDKAKDK